MIVVVLGVVCCCYLFRDPVVIYKANSIKLFSSRILTLNPFREIKIRFGWETNNDKSE